MKVSPSRVYGRDQQNGWTQSAYLRTWCCANKFKVVGFHPVTPGCEYVNYIHEDRVTHSTYNGPALGAHGIQQPGNWRIILEVL